jgi:hypothetical protein
MLAISSLAALIVPARRAANVLPLAAHRLDARAGFAVA